MGDTNQVVELVLDKKAAKILFSHLTKSDFFF